MTSLCDSDVFFVIFDVQVPLEAVGCKFKIKKEQQRKWKTGFLGAKLKVTQGQIQWCS